VAVELFLDPTGCGLAADNAGCMLTMLVVAAGQIDEATFVRMPRRQTQWR
jgi:hypothetical protein